MPTRVLRKHGTVNPMKEVLQSSQLKHRKRRAGAFRNKKLNQSFIGDDFIIDITSTPHKQMILANNRNDLHQAAAMKEMRCKEDQPT